MEFYLIIIIILLIAGFALLFREIGRATAGSSVLAGKIEVLNDAQERTDRSMRDEIARLRAESQALAQQERSGSVQSFKVFEDSMNARLTELTAATEKKIEAVRVTLDGKLGDIQENNARQLEKMRETVDEKLHNTLETRLGAAFKLVSDRLELVQKGLGEMQTLASGVGDLKKVLQNVKTKGVLGEYQLGAILEQILTPAQYDQNIKTKNGSDDHVEYVVKIPGKDDSSKIIWLPIDAKFPTEDYTRLMNAYETGDVSEIEAAAKSLKTKIEKFAKDIHAKYVDPPNTTDFAIMFLPFEGLFAEVLRIPGLFENVQRAYKVTITGPTTIAAFLNSLQMGFRTLAIQKRSGEVWRVLGEVKTAFGKFTETLETVRRKLEQASTTVDEAQRKTKTLSNKLKSVEMMPDSADASGTMLEQDCREDD